MAVKASDTERGSDGKFHCGCGESFQHAAWYTKHALRCAGKPVQTRGRIERLASRRGTKTPQTTATKRRGRRRAVHVPPAPAAASGPGPVAPLTPAAMLAALRAEAAKIQNAIAAIEALG